MKRFDKGFLFYHMITDFFSALFLVACFGGVLFDNADEESTLTSQSVLIFAAMTLALYIIMVIRSAIFVKISWYELTDTAVKCRKGVLFRKESVLEYSKIHAVNKKANLIHKLFGLAVLTLDSGSANTAYSAEITIYEKEPVIDELVRQIKAREAGAAPGSDEVAAADGAEAEFNQSSYHFSTGAKLIYSAINVLLCAAWVLVLCLCAELILPLFYRLISLDTFSGKVLWITAVVAAFFIVGLALFMFVVFIITSFVGYYDYKVRRTRDSLEIQYGLLVKNSNTFRLNRIKAVKISRSILERAFGFASAQLEVIGYGTDAGENNNKGSGSVGMLFPLFRFQETGELLSELLPDYVPQPSHVKSKSYPAFLMWRLFGAGIFYAVLFAIAGCFAAAYPSYSDMILGIPAMLGFISLVWMALQSLFEYRAQGLCISPDKLTVYHGGLTQKITVIGLTNVIAIENVTTPMKQKRDIHTIRIHFCTNALTNVITVKNLDTATLAALRKVLPD